MPSTGLSFGYCFTVEQALGCRFDGSKQALYYAGKTIAVIEGNSEVSGVDFYVMTIGLIALRSAGRLYL
jgi:hypothetical protein